MISHCHLEIPESLDEFRENRELYSIQEELSLIPSKIPQNALNHQKILSESEEQSEKEVVENE